MPYRSPEEKRKYNRDLIRQKREALKITRKSEDDILIDAPNEADNIKLSAIKIAILTAKKEGCHIPYVSDILSRIDSDEDMLSEFLNLWKKWIVNPANDSIKPRISFDDKASGFAKGNWYFTEKQLVGSPRRNKKLSFQQLCEELYLRAKKHQSRVDEFTICNLDEFLEYINWDDYKLHEAFNVWEQHGFDIDWKPRMNPFSYQGGYQPGSWTIDLNNGYGNEENSVEQRFNEGSTRFSFYRSPLTNAGHRRINPDGSFVLVWDPKYELKYTPSKRMTDLENDMQDIIYTAWSNLDEISKKNLYNIAKR